MSGRAEMVPRLGWSHGVGAGTALPQPQAPLVCWLASFERSRFPRGCEKRAASLALSRVGLHTAPFPP